MLVVLVPEDREGALRQVVGHVRVAAVYCHHHTCWEQHMK